MPPEVNADLTTMLKQWRDGSGTAFADLIDRVYDELKVIAKRRLSQSGGSATMTASCKKCSRYVWLTTKTAPPIFLNR
jgi:hypothetical protein